MWNKINNFSIFADQDYAIVNRYQDISIDEERNQEKNIYTERSQKTPLNQRLSQREEINSLVLTTQKITQKEMSLPNSNHSLALTPQKTAQIPSFSIDNRSQETIRIAPSSNRNQNSLKNYVNYSHLLIINKPIVLQQEKANHEKERKQFKQSQTQQVQKIEQQEKNTMNKTTSSKIEPKINQSRQEQSLNKPESIQFSLNFAGLPNVGNTCFLNSTIQFLFGATQFREKLIETISKMQIGFEDKQKREAFLLGSIFQLLKESDESPNNFESKSEKLRELAICLQSLNLQYKVHSQDDAFQTLNNLLNKIYDQLPELQLKYYFNILSTLTCSCKLPLIHLETLFLSDRVQICNTCKNPFTKHFTDLPPYIILINLANTDTVRRIQDKPYRLKSKINYYGNRKSGHYTCSRVEQIGKQFHSYCFNDSTVRKETDDERSSEKNIRVALFEQISQEEYQQQTLKHKMNKLIKNQNNIFLVLWNKGLKHKKILMFIIITILSKYFLPFINEQIIAIPFVNKLIQKYCPQLLNN